VGWHGTCGAFIQGKAKQSRSGEINGVLPDRQRSNREWSVGQSAIQKGPPEDRPRGCFARRRTCLQASSLLIRMGIAPSETSERRGSWLAHPLFLFVEFREADRESESPKGY
jgi:hypothetical protein